MGSTLRTKCAVSLISAFMNRKKERFMKHINLNLKWLLGNRIRNSGLIILCFFPTASHAYVNIDMSYTFTIWVVGLMFGALISVLIASERDFNTGKIVKVRIGKFLISFFWFFISVFFLGLFGLN